MERERAKSEGVSNRNPHSLLMMLKNGTARRTMVQLAISNKSRHTLNIALLGIYSNELKTYVNPKKKKSHTQMAAAAAKSLQSCPTLCDPIDGSPSGSSVPGILQAGTLEWVAISFSNAGK